MMTVLCDASPLIFLAKLDRLDLIREFLGERILATRLVVSEICRADAPAGELQRLNRFLEGIEVLDFEESGHPSLSLSRSDQASLRWAIQNRPDWLLVDERLLRRVAVGEGLNVIGTLGLLFAAVRAGAMGREELGRQIDELVATHGFRISVELYQRLLKELTSL